ncbi:MAG: hypothetical protein PHO10_10315 [Gemmiger sp.]|nr:hypothetical protein [Gemmiger sp.]
MKHLFQIERYIFSQSRAFYWILAGLVGLNLAFLKLSPVSGVAVDGAYLTNWLFSDIATLFCACAIFSGFQICTGFSNGTVRSIVAAGQRRTAWLISKYVAWLLPSLALLLLDPLVTTLAAAALGGQGLFTAAVFVGIVRRFCLSVPLYAGVLSAFFLVGILFQNSGIAISINVVLALLLYGASRPNGSGSAALLQYSPSYQLSIMGSQANVLSLPYLVACSASIAFSLLFLFLCVLRFRYQDVSHAGGL